MSDYTIYHIFADTGAESEPLSGYGTVYRLGLDPLDLNESQPIRGDANQVPMQPGADLVWLDPKCQRWSSSTPGTGNPEDHEDQIDLARELGETLGDHYVIENVPQAPLRDPVRLSGKMFGLPIVFRRDFETSFPVPQPEERQDLVPREGPLADQGTTSKQWVGDKEMWRTAKQLSGDYPAKDLKRHAIPAPYVHYLVQYWLTELKEPLEGDSVERQAALGSF